MTTVSADDDADGDGGGRLSQDGLAWDIWFTGRNSHIYDVFSFDKARFLFPGFLRIFIIHQTTQDTDLHSAGGRIFYSSGFCSGGER